MNPSVMDNEKKPRPETPRQVDGLFRGLESVLKAAADLADKTQSPIDFTRTGSAGAPGGLQALYGVSVRVGPGKTPGSKFPNLGFRSQKPARVEEIHEPIGDVFDEGDHYLVVAELPGVDASKVEWHTRAGTVCVSGSSVDRKYYKQFQLPSPIDDGRHTSSFKNGILELRLWKMATE